MRKLLACALAFPLFLSSCDFMGERVSGDGNIVTQDRNLSDFNSIDVSGGFQVYITQDSSFSVKVETDQNLQEFIQVRKNGSALQVSQRGNTNLQSSREMKIYVSAPAFQHLEASGACHLMGQTPLRSSERIGVDMSGASEARLEIRTPRLELELTGDCSADLRGEVKDFVVKGTGGSNVKAFDLLSENADIDVTGACNVDIFASVKIHAGGSGASNIRYKGNASVSSDVSGASSVKKVE